MIVSEERITKALNFLAKTDEDAARAKAYLERLESQKKEVVSVEALRHEGKCSQKAAEYKAYSSDAFKSHCDLIERAAIESYKLKERRETARMIIEVWRSLNANRRQGNI